MPTKHLFVSRLSNFSLYKLLTNVQKLNNVFLLDTK